MDEKQRLVYIMKPEHTTVKMDEAMKRLHARFRRIGYRVRYKKIA